MARMRRAAAWIAAASLGAAALADPPSVAALNEEGIAQLAAGRPSEAAAAFEAASALRPDAEVLSRNLAAALALRGEELGRERRPAEAIRVLERAVSLHPTRLRYRVLLGRARFEEGDDALRMAAREDFAYVLGKDPDHLDALVNLGEILYLSRELEPAVGHLRHAVALAPDEPGIAARLAKAERELEVERSFGEISGSFFLVRYSPRITADRAQAVLLLCEEARGRLTATYGSYPPRIAVTLYTPDEFRSATDLHGWVSGLSDGTIRLTLGARTDPAALKGTICHELTHHILRAIAPGTPVWLHEGLAQVEEGRDVDRARARLRGTGALPVALLNADVLRQADPRRVELFYDIALAFTAYLDDAHRGGVQRFLRALGEGKSEAEAFRETFGDSRESLFDRWKTGLE